MLTLKKFEEFNSNEVFAEGIAINSPEEIYMTDRNVGKELFWVAVKGYADDWAIYMCWNRLTDVMITYTNKEIFKNSQPPSKYIPKTNEQYIKDYCISSGDKVRNKNYIQKLVPCKESVLKRYRY